MGEAAMSRQAFPQAVLLTFLVMFLHVSSGSAQLTVARPVEILGTIRSGPPLVRTFGFVNAGALPVEIVDVKGSCSCVVPKLAKRIYQPGEQGTIELEVHTLGQAAGPNSWGLTLTCKTGDQLTQVPLKITADLISEVYCEPAALQLMVREGLSATVAIRWLKGLFPSLKAVNSSSPHLKVQIEPGVISDGGTSSQWVRVEVDQDYPEGQHQEVVSIYTDHPNYREMTVPVAIIKRGKQRVSATPSQIVLNLERGQPVPSRIVLLRDEENQPVQIEKVECDHAAVSCSWAQGPGAMVTLKIRVDQAAVGYKLLNTGAHVRVEISQPVRQTVIVPVEVRQDW
jgi:hypothetical protein